MEQKMREYLFIGALFVLGASSIVGGTYLFAKRFPIAAGKPEPHFTASNIADGVQVTGRFSPAQLEKLLFDQRDGKINELQLKTP